MNACSFLLATSVQLQRYKDFSFIGHFKKSTSENTNTVAFIGHSGDDVNHRKPHKMKTH